MYLMWVRVRQLISVAVSLNSIKCHREETFQHTVSFLDTCLGFQNGIDVDVATVSRGDTALVAAAWDLHANTAKEILSRGWSRDENY